MSVIRTTTQLTTGALARADSKAFDFDVVTDKPPLRSRPPSEPPETKAPVRPDAGEAKD